MTKVEFKRIDFFFLMQIHVYVSRNVFEIAIFSFCIYISFVVVTL